MTARLTLRCIKRHAALTDGAESLSQPPRMALTAASLAVSAAARAFGCAGEWFAKPGWRCYYFWLVAAPGRARSVHAYPP